MFAPEAMQQIDRLNSMKAATNDEQTRVWFAYVLFSWHWWLDLAMSVLPWVLWFIVRDRKNTYSLLCAGFFAAVVAFFLDMWACLLGFGNTTPGLCLSVRNTCHGFDRYAGSPDALLPALPECKALDQGDRFRSFRGVCRGACFRMAGVISTENLAALLFAADLLSDIPGGILVLHEKQEGGTS